MPDADMLQAVHFTVPPVPGFAVQRIVGKLLESPGTGVSISTQSRSEAGLLKVLEEHDRHNLIISCCLIGSRIGGNPHKSVLLGTFWWRC